MTFKKKCDNLYMGENKTEQNNDVAITTII